MSKHVRMTSSFYYNDEFLEILCKVIRRYIHWKYYIVYVSVYLKNPI